MTLQTLPTEILLQIIEDYLTPIEHFCLALTCHPFLDTIFWALQEPDSIAPSDEPSLKRLSRQNLRDWFGIKYIYCGMPSDPKVQMHKYLPLRKFAKSAHHHMDCDCLQSLEVRASRLENASPKDKGRAAHQAQLKAVTAARDFLRYVRQRRTTRRQVTSRSRVLGAYKLTQGLSEKQLREAMAEADFLLARRRWYD